MPKARIYKIINKHFQFVKKDKLDFLIIDDFLPAVLSPWRSFEFNELVTAFPKSVVITDQTTFVNYNQNKSYHQSIKELEKTYPVLAEKITPLKLFLNINTKLAYIIFYRNIFKYFPFFEYHKIPFAFTLYPGGGFFLNNEQITKNLRNIFSSQFFRGVIVNQYKTFDYILSNQLCDEKKIRLIHGVPLNLSLVDNEKWQLDLRSKRRINIAFMAHRYTGYGYDKGFDLYQLIAKYLLQKDKNFVFHVIGDFSEKDLLNSDMTPNFVFHGLLEESKYNEIFTKTSLIISPNRPDVLCKGAYDGFPIGAAINAALLNNVMCLTDMLNEGERAGWIDGINYIQISLDPYESAMKIFDYISNENVLYKIEQNAHEKVLLTYGYEFQIKQRVDFLVSLMDK